MIDHIDVIRGPAAARYGNGAMGGRQHRDQTDHA